MKWFNIPGEKINWQRLVEIGTAHRPYDKAVEPTHLKCPRCTSSVIWTDITTEAETCDCSFKWFVAGGTNGGVYIFGTRSGFEEIESFLV